MKIKLVVEAFDLTLAKQKLAFDEVQIDTEITQEEINSFKDNSSKLTNNIIEVAKNVM